jgi:hypothetical protein
MISVQPPQNGGQAFTESGKEGKQGSVYTELVGEPVELLFTLRVETSLKKVKRRRPYDLQAGAMKARVTVERRACTRSGLKVQRKPSRQPQVGETSHNINRSHEGSALGWVSDGWMHACIYR